MDVLVIIINRSSGRIGNLHDLAIFLKSNVNLKEYKVTQEGAGFLGLGTSTFETRPLTTLSSCMAVLKYAFNISDYEAREAISLLCDANFLWMDSSETMIKGRGLDHLIRFDI